MPLHMLGGSSTFLDVISWKMFDKPGKLIFCMSTIQLCHPKNIVLKSLEACHVVMLLSYVQKKTLHVLNSLKIPYMLFNEICLKISLRMKVRSEVVALVSFAQQLVYWSVGQRVLGSIPSPCTLVAGTIPNLGLGMSGSQPINVSLSCDLSLSLNLPPPSSLPL